MEQKETKKRGRPKKDPNDSSTLPKRTIISPDTAQKLGKPLNTVKQLDKFYNDNKVSGKTLIATILNIYGRLNNADKVRALIGLDVGENFFTCYLCSKIKPRSQFYSSTDPLAKSGVSRVCRDCCEDLAMPYYPGTNERQFMTRESLIESLRYSDNPFKEHVWENAKTNAAKDERENLTYSVYGKYRIGISSAEYRSATFKDSSMFDMAMQQSAQTKSSKSLFGDVDKNVSGEEIETVDAIVLEEIESNRSDVIRLLGYDPFMSENEEDTPQLYSNLLGIISLEEDANEDMFKTSSAISIVRGFLQLSKIDNIIASLSSDPATMKQNINAIKSLQDAKQKVNQTILNLAEANCLSLKHNRNASKGEDTWTGKVKKLKEINLREAEVNAFDIETAAGIAQVADISNASIIKQLALDENDYTEMITSQRLLIDKYRKESSKHEEQARILLRENLDLKDFIEENELDLKKYMSTPPIPLDDIDINGGDNDE